MSKAILGGGLSGLSAAYYLSKKLPHETLLLFEASSRTGGWIKSTLQNNVIFEQGPRTIRPRGESGENTLNLIEELGLGNKIVPIGSCHPAAQKRLIYAKGNLHLLPSSVTGLFRKGDLFTKPLILHLLKDIGASKKITQDDSIYDFINRRFGTEIADYLISPLICGICAGNAKEISVNFLMKELFEYEQKFGSITKGIINKVFSGKAKHKKELTGLSLKAKTEKWNVYSFIDGCETLPLTLSYKIRESGVKVNLNSECQKINFNNNKSIILKINNQEYEVDHLFSCIPSYCLARLVENQHPELAYLLKELTKNVTVAVINLHFKKSLLKEPAFGFLVAPKEKLPILGVIYDSCCFPAQERTDTVLTVMMGGHWFEEHFGTQPKEEQLLQIALTQLKTILGVNEEPYQHKINILKNCIPQYVVGHNKKLADINNYVNKNNLPLSLCGASYYGVSVNDVILSSKNAVDRLL